MESQSLVTFENSKQYNVLIVQDDAELQSFLKDSLKDYFKIITADKGEKALDVLKDIINDLIINDISMPSITGIDLLKTIKVDVKT